MWLVLFLPNVSPGWARGLVMSWQAGRVGSISVVSNKVRRVLERPCISRSGRVDALLSILMYCAHFRLVPRVKDGGAKVTKHLSAIHSSARLRATKQNPSAPKGRRAHQEEARHEFTNGFFAYIVQPSPTPAQGAGDPTSSASA